MKLISLDELFYPRDINNNLKSVNSIQNPRLSFLLWYFYIIDFKFQQNIKIKRKEKEMSNFCV